jgi:hypothetical protein
MSVDTDTEIAFANNSPVFFKQKSLSSTPRNSSKESLQPRRPTAPRRRWSLFEQEDKAPASHPTRSATHDSSQADSVSNLHHSTSSTTNFFARLRNRSSGLSSPLTSLRLGSSRRSGSQQASENGYSWTSDSSSDDEIVMDWRQNQQLSPLNFPVVDNPEMMLDGEETEEVDEIGTAS